MKLLFHCCCAPCSVSCLDALSAEGITPTLFWYNPNIHPYTEYTSRRDTLKEFCSSTNKELIMVDEYGLYDFLRGAQPVLNEGPQSETAARCAFCYRLRLEKTAQQAAEQGFDAFSTSLLVSPYQQHDTIRRIGEELAAQYHVDFLYRDFRPNFREGQAKARAMGMYMQKYCGCILSEAEKRTLRQAQRPMPELCTLSPESVEGPKGVEASPRAENFFQRMELIVGEAALKKFMQTKVIVFGLGGVGSWCAEALVRSGIGKIGIVDFDTICESNVNRQIEATSRTLGQSKASALRDRLLEINPHCEVTAHEKIFSRDNADEFGIEKADYVIDAIDSLSQKIDLIEKTCGAGVKLFSSMGMARKMDPTQIKTADIWKTKNCALAKNVRHGLRERGFSGNFTAVYSDEVIPNMGESGVEHNATGDKRINGSAVTVTAAAGMVLASLVLRDISGSGDEQ